MDEGLPLQSWFHTLFPWHTLTFVGLFAHIPPTQPQTPQSSFMDVVFPLQSCQYASPPEQVAEKYAL